MIFSDVIILSLCNISGSVKSIAMWSGVGVLQTSKIVERLICVLSLEISHEFLIVVMMVLKHVKPLLLLVAAFVNILVE